MTSITIHLDDNTEARLRVICEELQRDVSELAECAVAEAALNFFRGRSIEQDPANRSTRSNLQ